MTVEREREIEETVENEKRISSDDKSVQFVFNVLFPVGISD